jgi:hypothetical protein
VAGEDLVGADPHDQGADETEEEDSGLGEEGDAGEGAEDVIEEAADAFGKDGLFAFFGVVALNDANAAEGFLEAAADFSLDLVALLKQRAHSVEAEEHGGGDGEDDDEGKASEQGAGDAENGEGKDGGEEAAEEVDEAGSDEVAEAFDVVHDAADEFAGFVAVKIGDGEAADVDLDFAAHVGDEALGGFGEDLGYGKRAAGLNESGGDDGRNERGKKLVPAFADDVIYQKAGGGGEGKAGAAADDDEHDTDGELDPEGLDDGQNVGKKGPEPENAGVFGGGCHK